MREAWHSSEMLSDPYIMYHDSVRMPISKYFHCSDCRDLLSERLVFLFFVLNSLRVRRFSLPRFQFLRMVAELHIPRTNERLNPPPK
jgi:hypothetical protein